MSALSRRALLSGLTALAASSLPLPRRARASQPRSTPLTIWGPPAGPTITLAHGAATGAFSPLADRTEIRVWRTPDDLRAGLTSGTMDIMVLPTQTAASLYQRGLRVRLVSVMTTGLLYMVSADPGLTTLPALRGRTVAVPFRNDIPDLLLHHLLRHHGLTPGQDLTVQVTASPVEAVQMLLTGRADCALLPEPAASAALLKAAQLFGKTLHRMIDLQQAWASATGSDAVLPQAGLGATPSGLDRLGPDAALRLQQAIARATADTLANPDAAARHASDLLGFPADVLSRSIATSNLSALPARQVRPALERLFSLLPPDASTDRSRPLDAEFYL
ncbi:ABC transporter substrate-binding protein [Novispirillum itersonii]|uniref:NitT/TauT family transport system substrate-binding protein n=1 Tax=Novispirillum itersonii TaxID=189 RepID=A0A7W9ZDS5_NOVIT|nr:PhnD/SsuA/transferrin family substrate-binding protein [Novispirillum itersonii]MBB6209390.1 NitT/TauT family transport system substrate-binding protein [Novispirillum itersonii]